MNDTCCAAVVLYQLDEDAVNLPFVSKNIREKFDVALEFVNIPNKNYFCHVTEQEALKLKILRVCWFTKCSYCERIRQRLADPYGDACVQYSSP